MTAYLEPERIYTEFINENISKEVAILKSKILSQ